MKGNSRTSWELNYILKIDFFSGIQYAQHSWEVCKRMQLLVTFHRFFIYAFRYLSLASLPLSFHLSFSATNSYVYIFYSLYIHISKYTETEYLVNRCFFHIHISKTFYVVCLICSSTHSECVALWAEISLLFRKLNVATTCASVSYRLYCICVLWWIDEHRVCLKPNV